MTRPLAAARPTLGEVASKDVHDLVVQPMPVEAPDVAFGGDDEVVGAARNAGVDPGSQLGVTSEGFADPTLDTAPRDRVADLFGDRDAKPALRALTREELKDQVPRVHALTLALDAQELTPREDAAPLGEALSTRAPRARGERRARRVDAADGRHIVDATLGVGVRRR